MSYDSKNEMLAKASGVGTGDLTESSNPAKKAEHKHVRIFNVPKTDLQMGKEVLEAQGFKFVEDSEHFQVTFPEGWRLEEEDWHFSIIDDKGRRRGTYSNDGGIKGKTSSIKFCQRFYASFEFLNEDIFEDTNILVGVQDSNGVFIYEAGKCTDITSEKFKKLMDQTMYYLETNYPEWEKVGAYWD